MSMWRDSPVLLAAIMLVVGGARSLTAQAAGQANLKEYQARLNLAYTAAEGDEAKAQLAHAIANAAQIERDIEKAGVWKDRVLAVYAVPAISSIKRLPDVIPPDGELSDQVKIIAAKGEFEPASFVVFPLKDISALELRVSALVGRQREIPAAAIDAKVVKCWYQAGTAWHSYFADPTRRELVPELLLHDDSLIRVDYKTQDNYLRADCGRGWKRRITGDVLFARSEGRNVFSVDHSIADGDFQCVRLELASSAVPLSERPSQNRDPKSERQLRHVHFHTMGSSV